MLHRFASITRILLAAVAAFLGVSAFAAPAALAAAPAVSPFGMCSHLLWGYSTTAIDHELDLMKAAGTSWVRIDVSWRDMEPADNAYNTKLLASLDHIVSAAASRGISVAPVVMEFPDWANGGKGMWTPPTDDADFAGFMRYMAARYAGKIGYWELGNEVNEQDFFAVSRTLSPARYTRFLQSGYAGVKAGNPAALVISAGLAGSDDRYLQEMYDAGAQGSFDVLGVHTYTRGRSPYAVDLNTPSATFDGLAIMKSTMERNGDAAKKIWITEAGWQTSDVGYHVTQEQQAQYTYEAYQRLGESFPYVETLFIYGLRDNHANLSVSTDNYGLMTTTYAAKPAYAAYRRASEAFGQIVETPVVTPVETPTAPIATPAETSAAPATVTVTPRPTIKGSKTTVRRRGTVVVSGGIVQTAVSGISSIATTPTSASVVRVTLQRRVGHRWINVKRASVRSTGGYRVSIRPGTHGTRTYRVRVVSAGIVTSSRTIRVRVR